jgi:hypothetical protein
MPTASEEEAYDAISHAETLLHQARSGGYREAELANAAATVSVSKMMRVLNETLKSKSGSW